MMVPRGSHRNGWPRAWRRIFFRPQSLRHCRDAGSAPAFRGAPFAARIADSFSSLGVGRRDSPLSHRIFCGQNSLLRRDLGCDPHLHSSARCRASCFCRRWRSPTGMALGCRAARRWSRSRFARHKSQRASRRQCQPRAIEQLGIKFWRRRLSRLADLDGNCPSSCHDHHCCRTSRALSLFALPSFPFCASRSSAPARLISLYWRSDRVGAPLLGKAIPLFHVRRHPIQKRLVPKLRILWFQDPVTLIGKNHQLRRHFLPLQRAEKFERLRVRYAVIPLSRNYQRRRLEFSQLARVRHRRPRPVPFWIRPRRALHVVLFKPKLFRRVHRHFVVHAGVAHDGLEPSPVRRNPVRHVPAIRSPRRGHACPIDERIFFQCIVHAIHHVGVRSSAPVIRNLIREFLPIPRRPAPVDHQRHVSRCGKNFGVPPLPPPIPPHPLLPPLPQSHLPPVFHPPT